MEDSSMKFLYALVSDEKDIYYEQTLCSMLSLRHYNPEAFISLLVDDGTDGNLSGFRGKIRELVQEYKVVEFESGVSNMVRSRLLKTGMRNLVDGDFLFLDGDTAIVDRLDGFPESLGDVAAVSDLHSGEGDRYRVRHKRFRTSLEKLGFSLDLKNLYFNSGAIYAKDSPAARAFFEKWHELYRYCAEHSVFTDQFSFNETNHRLGFPIRELPGEWNCQVREAYNHLYRVRTIYPILCGAKIIHFFGSGRDGKKEPHPLMKKSFFENIKRNGAIGEEDLRILYNAKNEFYGMPKKLLPRNRHLHFFIYRQFPKLCRAIHIVSTLFIHLKRSLQSFLGINDDFFLTKEQTRAFERFLLRRESRFHLNAMPREQKIVVSFTTFPPRFHMAHYAIRSMLQQTFPPDEIILYLDEDDVSENIEKELPKSLLDMRKWGVKIEWRKGRLKCHKKYFHALREFSDSIVITIDDDAVYPPNLIETLYRAHEKFPLAVVATRAHRITFDEMGNPNLYENWEKAYSKARVPRMDLVPTGCGGILYPPHRMPQSLFRTDLFLKLAPNADDLWLKINQVLNGVETVVSDFKTRKRIGELQECQSVALNNCNLRGGNDICIRRLLEYFRLSAKDFGINE